MAAELVVGALVSASLNILLEKIASPCVVEFFKGNKRSGSARRLHDLKLKFMALSAVLADAEQKQNKVPGVKEWLDELKDAVDDAEDLFGDIEYDALKLKVEKDMSRSLTTKVRNKLSKLVNSTGSKRISEMDEVFRRLDQFEKQISILHLVSDVKKEDPRERSPTTSLPDEPEIYGRDHDKDALMKLLMSDHVGTNQKMYDVIPIVGMGGVGKTTLAQTLFNDEQVKNKFEVLVWVYVSDKFDAVAVTKTILQRITPDDACSDMDLDSLQVNLSKNLMGKKFFIILDDAWEDDYVCWTKVMKPFNDGAKGSKMIVTTRSAKVAERTGTLDAHHLRELSEDECWELFANHASNGKPAKFKEYPNLESIGRKLVKKCNGLPLAAKVLGGLLRSTWTVERWEQIAKSNIWELSKTPPALEVSYHYLPPHLKRCFAYCSIFPKGYDFEREELVSIWMAENLVKHSEGSRRMEEVGNEYFDDLVSLSFFQIKTCEFGGNIVCMHDLMVDLARGVSGKYNGFLEHSEDIDKFDNRTRHLGCVIELLCFDEKISTYDFEPTRLRSFLALVLNDQYLYKDMSIPKEVVHHLVSKLKRLRVLSFRYSDMTEFSDSIGELKSLCYLDLSFTNIVKLPESITVLYNLQTLKLEGCSELKTLPKDMHHLINLRHLTVCGTELVEMPCQISKLKNLQVLSTFIVGKESGAKIEELGQLSSLRGRVSIENLENVVIRKASDQVNVLERKQLEELVLNWSPVGDGDDPKCGEGVLDMLAANTTLKQLEIDGYPGTRFPNWIGSVSFDNIVEIKLSDCKRCSNLPPLGQLCSLKHIEISGFDSVLSVGSEFYGNSYGRKPFSALESLSFCGMSSWEQWHSMQTEDATTYGKLKTLRITSCPKFIGDLPRFLPSLTKIKVDTHEQCVLRIPRLPCAIEIDITYLDNRELLEEAIKPTKACVEQLQQQQHMTTCTACLPTTIAPFYHPLQSLHLSDCGESFRSLNMDLFPNLKTLCVSFCYYFISLSISSNGKFHEELTSLSLTHCPSFVSFRNRELIAPKLTSLVLDYCPIKRLPEKMSSLSSLTRLAINNCPFIETIPKGGMPISLSTLVMSYHQLLVMKWNWQTLPHLTSLSIGGSGEDIDSFPKEGLLPATITFLEISFFKKLTGLDRDGLRQLTSLQRLSIDWCPELQKLSEEGFPTSLTSLEIRNCPLLKKTYSPKESDNNKFLDQISCVRNVQFHYGGF